MSKISLTSLLSLTIILLVSWGNSGHYKISLSVSQNLPEEMSEFHDWNIYLADHASDPDWRRDDDPAEGPKHYIDIDNYSEFLENGFINQDLEYLKSTYGAGFVKDNGYLPWATINSYDSLVSCFERRDWNKAKFFAADLGHYVADGFMPLHITRNYNGQYSGNYGIHSRFESDMINKYKNEIEIEPREAKDIDDIPDYVFNYIYNSYEYMDSVLQADDYGKSINSNTGSSEYIEAMWEFSSQFTIELFNSASHAFASLFYMAWKEAGKPLISSTAVDKNAADGMELIKFYPNPAKNNLTININAHSLIDFDFLFISPDGRILDIESFSNNQLLTHQLSKNLDSYSPGQYYFLLRTAEYIETKRVLLVK